MGVVGVDAAVARLVPHPRLQPPPAARRRRGHLPPTVRVNSAEPHRSGAARARRGVALTPSAALPVPPRVPRWPCSSTVGFSQLSKGSAQESSSRWRQRAASARPTNPGIRINPCHRARAPRQRAAQQTWGQRWGGAGWGDEIFGGGRGVVGGQGAQRTSRWKASIWSRLSSGRASDASPSIPVALCLCSVGKQEFSREIRFWRTGDSGPLWRLREAVQCPCWAPGRGRAGGKRRRTAWRARLAVC